MSIEFKVSGLFAFLGGLVATVAAWSSSTVQMSLRLWSALVFWYFLMSAFQLWALLGNRSKGSGLPAFACLLWLGTGLACIGMHLSEDASSSASAVKTISSAHVRRDNDIDPTDSTNWSPEKGKVVVQPPAPMLVVPALQVSENTNSKDIKNSCLHGGKQHGPSVAGHESAGESSSFEDDSASDATNREHVVSEIRSHSEDNSSAPATVSRAHRNTAKFPCATTLAHGEQLDDLVDDESYDI